MASNILLEAGTNEMELLVFKLGDTPFGINVAKVREIVQRTKTISIPYTPHGVEGSFKIRDSVMTLVNLGQYFSMQGEQTANGDGMIIVVEFNNIQCGVLVDSVERIHRLRWDEIAAPSQYLIDTSAPVTGTAFVDEQTVLIADFETIISKILGVDSANLLAEDGHRSLEAGDIRILLVDDSSVLRLTLEKILTKAGYSNLTVCTDGQHAWETIDERRSEPDGAFDLVLTDIEMPRMDGLHLTHKIKQDAELQNIPVVLFSSLISEDNKVKGKAVGADAQVSKPDSKGMIEAIESCVAVKA